MVYYDYWPYLMGNLNSLYRSLGKSASFDKDCPYLEKAYKSIEKLWHQQYESIKTINYIMFVSVNLKVYHIH